MNAVARFVANSAIGHWASAVRDVVWHGALRAVSSCLCSTSLREGQSNALSETTLFSPYSVVSWRNRLRSFVDIILG